MTFKIYYFTGAKAAADVMSPVLNLSPTEILKNNEGMLEKDLRKSIALPSTPSDLVSSSEKAATDAKIKTTRDIELKRKKMEVTKKNAVASVKKEIETKLETAREENGLVEGTYRKLLVVIVRSKCFFYIILRLKNLKKVE